MCAGGGRAWQGGGRAWLGEMATAAGGTHPTGMHSCFCLLSYFITEL